MKAMVAQNQTCFLKFQRILIATIVTPRTMQTVSPISALPKKTKTRNTGIKWPLF